MISVCVIGVPILWVVYALLMALAGFSLKHIGLYLFWCPFFSYLAVIATEAGMVDLKDLKPLLLRLMVRPCLKHAMCVCTLCVSYVNEYECTA